MELNHTSLSLEDINSVHLSDNLLQPIDHGDVFSRCDQQKERAQEGRHQKENRHLEAVMAYIENQVHTEHHSEYSQADMYRSDMISMPRMVQKDEDLFHSLLNQTS
jgi:hypothetical protein